MTPEERLARHRRLEEADHRHLWHPFTQMQDWLGEEPIIVDAAEGAWLVDTLGNRYLDGVSSLWCNVHGHRVPEIDRAVQEQLGRVAHTTLLGLASTASIECAEELVRVLPRGLTRVFYSDAGATAVEVALKMAYQHHQLRGDGARKEFVSIRGGYHGDTIGSVSIGGIDLFHRIFKPLLFPVHQAPQPYCYRCPLGKRPESCAMECAGEVEKVFEAHRGKIAALVIEPLMQGADGMIAQPRGHLRTMREICDRHGALLVCDEVATGFGRTGTLFASEQCGLRPDLLCLGKGITGGYLAMSATVASGEVYGAFLGADLGPATFYHGHSYGGNALASAVALEHLRAFSLERQHALERQRVELARQRLVERRTLLAVQHRVVDEVGWRVGLVGGDEIDERRLAHRLQRIVRSALLAEG